MPHSAGQPHLYAAPLKHDQALGVIQETQNNPTTGVYHERLSALDNTSPTGLRVTLQDDHTEHCDKTNNNTSCFPVCINLTGHYKLNSIDVTHCNTTIDIPAKVNLTALGDVYWLCGWRAYTRLPVNTTTVRTPVTVTDHTYIISYRPVTSSTRRRRFVEFQEHDPIWGSNVPWEHRYWTTGDRLIHALFPNIGVAKVALRVETIDYRLNSFIKCNH